MHMISVAIYPIQVNIFLYCILPYVLKQFISELIYEDWLPVFNTPDIMYPHFYIWHFNAESKALFG